MSQGKPRQNGTDQNLDQIREILFGEQNRDQHKRLKDFEKETSQSLTALRKEFREGLSSVSSELSQEVANLTKQLKDENSSRAGNEKSVASTLKQLNAALERKVAALEERLASREEQLRTLINKTQATIEDDYTRKNEELHALLEEELEDVRTTRADRVELSELFQELALRLTGELKRPAPRQ